MPTLPAKLDELLVDDCHVRFSQGLLRELVGDLTMRAKAIEQSLSSRTRFLPMIGRPEELAAVDAAKGELGKAKSAMESIERLQQLIEPGLMAETELYLRTVSEPYLRGCVAVANLAAWPGVVDQLAVRLEEMLESLGLARNMVSSGYDWQKQVFSPMAARLINQAVAVAQRLDEEIEIVNGLADRHHLMVAGTPHAGSLLPRVPVVGFKVRIERVLALNISEVQAEFNRILEMCGMLGGVGISGLREAMEGMVAGHEALGWAYVETYLTRLRAYTDEHRLVPAAVSERIRVLQARYLGETNFPFEMDA